MAASLVLCVALCGCRQVLGVDDKDFVDPAPSPLAQAANEPCVALPKGDARLRFVHASTAAARVDLCVRRPGQGAFVPLVSGDATCGDGLRYGEATAVLSVAPGQLELRVSPREKGCAQAIVEGRASLEAGKVTEVVLHAGAGGQIALAAPTLEAQSPGEVRVFAAIEGGGRLDVASDDGAPLVSTGPLFETPPPAVALPTGAMVLQATCPELTMAPVFGPFERATALLGIGKIGHPVYTPQLVVCSDDTGPIARCKGAEPPNFTLDTLNTYLGHNEFATAERQAVLIEQLKASPADALCLTESPLSPGDRAAFLAALAPHFAAVVSFDTNTDTPTDSPTDLHGQMPAELPRAPCEGLEADVQEFLDCAVANCSTVPGSDEGRLTSEGCFVDTCGGGVLGLLTTTERKTCAKCIQTMVADSSLREAVDTCGHQRSMPLRMHGQNDVVVLSRYPVSGADRWVLPSTGQRRIAVFARVDKPGASPVDVYCTRLTSIYDGVYDVYYGQYGEGSYGAKGWAAEQKLQAYKLHEYMMGRSREQRALLAGWFGVSRLVQDGDKLVIERYGPDTLAVLESLLVSAASPAQDAQCTACRDNPLYDDSFFDRRTDFIFLRGFDRDDVLSLDVVYDELDVTVTPSAASKGKSLVPVSDHYGLRGKIRLAR